MKLSVDEFREMPNKSVTLLGMSGVGKTRLAKMLRRNDWFHYSVDYRIATRYLDEPILDNIKWQAMQVPFLRALLRSDSIYISNNLTVDNLDPLSTFLGKLGDPEKGGLPLEEFKRRQKLHCEAEIAAIKDVPHFIRKAHEIYGYRHFVNDAGGSLCEFDDPEVLETLSQHSLVLYIRATESDENTLLRRAKTHPKTLFYREEFLDEHLRTYLDDRKIPYVALIDPDNFTRWVFPKLFHSRIPRYEAIASEHGYTVTTDELKKVRNVGQFLQLIEKSIDRADH